MKRTSAPKHYDVIKNTNKRIIRNLIRDNRIISKAELSDASGLSFPTVSQAVGELVKEGAITELSGKSNGGRPGNEYSIRAEYEQFLCGAFMEGKLVLRVYDYCGSLIHETDETIDPEFAPEDFVKIMRKVHSKYSKLKIAAIGIPGIASDGLIQHYPHLPKLEGKNLKTLVEQELSIELRLENDINMIAMAESNQWSSFAHIIWIDHCIGSAIVINNTLIHGAHGCAGEVEFVCRNRRNKEEALQDAMMAICAVVDVPIIAFSGSDITSDDMEKLRDHMQQTLPSYQWPELIFVPDESELYLKGLHTLVLGLLAERL